MDKHQPWCNHHRKRRYTTLHNAEWVAARAKKKRKIDLYIYPCDKRFGYHLSKKRPEGLEDQ